MCWLLLWIGINTGPGNLDLNLIEGSWTGFFNGVRAAFPLAVLVLWFFHILMRKQHRVRSFTRPEMLWLYYGIVCLIASAYAEPWFDYAYWGFAFLTAFAATEIYMSESSIPEKSGGPQSAELGIGRSRIGERSLGRARTITRTNLYGNEWLWCSWSLADRGRDANGASIGHIAACGYTGHSRICVVLEYARDIPRRMDGCICNSGVPCVGYAVARLTRLVRVRAQLCDDSDAGKAPVGDRPDIPCCSRWVVGWPCS